MTPDIPTESGFMFRGHGQPAYLALAEYLRLRGKRLRRLLLLRLLMLLRLMLLQQLLG